MVLPWGMVVQWNLEVGDERLLGLGVAAGQRFSNVANSVPGALGGPLREGRMWVVGLWCRVGLVVAAGVASVSDCARFFCEDLWKYRQVSDDFEHQFPTKIGIMHSGSCRDVPGLTTGPPLGAAFACTAADADCSSIREPRDVRLVLQQPLYDSIDAAAARLKYEIAAYAELQELLQRMHHYPHAPLSSHVNAPRLPTTECHGAVHASSHATKLRQPAEDHPDAKEAVTNHSRERHQHVAEGHDTKETTVDGLGSKRDTQKGDEDETATRLPPRPSVTGDPTMGGDTWLHAHHVCLHTMFTLTSVLDRSRTVLHL